MKILTYLIFITNMSRIKKTFLNKLNDIIYIYLVILTSKTT